MSKFYKRCLHIREIILAELIWCKCWITSQYQDPMERMTVLFWNFWARMCRMSLDPFTRNSQQPYPSVPPQSVEGNRERKKKEEEKKEKRSE